MIPPGLKTGVTPGWEVWVGSPWAVPSRAQGTWVRPGYHSECWCCDSSKMESWLKKRYGPCAFLQQCCRRTQIHDASQWLWAKLV